MNILLINTNPVVSRLVSLCMRDEEIYFEEVGNISTVSRDRYDLVLVDDGSYIDEVKTLLSHLLIAKKVFLSSRENGKAKEFFHSVIQKPFLPSQITELLEESIEDEALSCENILVPEEDDVPEVLNLNEIEKIKALLEDEAISVNEEIEEDYEARKVEVITQQLEAEGLEIVDEETLVQTLSKKEKKKKKKKKKSKQNEEVYTFEEALIAAVEGMKVKKIKKLLKGAEVSITINFKDKK